MTLHAETLAALGHLPADAAETDESQGLALDLGAGELGTFPFALLEAFVGLRDVARKRQEHRDGMFGGRDGIAARDIHDNHALSAGGGDIDVVHADAGAPDDLDFFGDRGNDSAVILRLAADNDGVDVRRRLFSGLPEHSFGLDSSLKLAVALEDL